MPDRYPEAIELARMERQLERCAATDLDYPPLERCARRTAMDCVWRCARSETDICNALAEAVIEEMNA